MKKQKKQSLLTGIIVILLVVLIVMIGSIVYEEKINMSKKQIQNTIAPVEDGQEYVEAEKEEEEQEQEKQEIPVEDAVEEDTEGNTSTEKNEEYIGEEENNTVQSDTTESKDEKAINLVQKKWGKDDTVTFNVEEKNGTKYYVAVKREATVVQWYEIDTETWEISEF